MVVPQTMQAQRLHHPGPVASRPLTLEQMPVPRPGPGQALIRVEACGICRTDLHVVEGELECRRSPVILGHQVVGTVAVAGDETSARTGARVGVAWLHRTCGACGFCFRGDENLCDAPDFTGWTVDGGYAEYVLAPADFLYALPDGLSPLQAAPLLCAGIIGFRCLQHTSLDDRGWAGSRLGLYGFGAAGHICIQLARARGAEVYVCTRDRERHQTLAAELGASWVGGATDRPPVPLDASIIFAPTGELVPVALAALDKGGVLVLGGIHMSPVPEMPYELICGERCMRSVANNTREDGRRFLEEAARIPVTTHVTQFPLEDANEALIAPKNDGFRGAGVLVLNAR